MKHLARTVVLMIFLFFTCLSGENRLYTMASYDEDSVASCAVRSSDGHTAEQKDDLNQEYEISKGVFSIRTFSRDLARVDVEIEFTNTTDAPVRLIEVLQVYTQQDEPLHASSAMVNGNPVSSVFDWVVQPSQSVVFSKAWHLQDTSENVILVCHDFNSSNDLFISLN